MQKKKKLISFPLAAGAAQEAIETMGKPESRDHRECSGKRHVISVKTTTVCGNTKRYVKCHTHHVSTYFISMQIVLQSNWQYIKIYIKKLIKYPGTDRAALL